MKKLAPIYTLLILAAVAVTLAFSLQYASLHPLQMSVFDWISHHSRLFALSAAILFLVLLGMTALFNNIYFAVAVGAAVIGGLSFSQYNKLKVLGEPVYPWDLNQLKNMKEMMQIARQMVPPIIIVIVLGLILLLLAATFWLPRKKWRLPFRLVSILAAAFAVFFSTHLHNPAFAKPLEKMGAADRLWNQRDHYLTNGFMVAFLKNIGAKIQQQPSDYSEAAMKEIVRKYGAAGGQGGEAAKDKPNIVFVMDEALFDLTRLPGVTFSEDPMPNLHQYPKTYATGWSLSPVFGGGTSNVEFEALTGLNMSFVNQGAVPYQQVLVKKKSFPSLVSVLKERGYAATAVHPFDPTFYNRNRVYPMLGFDRFIDQEKMQYKDKLSGYGYISDMSAVKETVDLLNKGDNPHFVHLVTMQNHFPVQEGMNGPNTISVSGLQESGKVELESYAQSVKETDKAIRYLVDSIQSIKRPTIVVMWGDHLPALAQQTYDQTLADMAPEQKQKFLHETPLLVAANFPLAEKDLGTVSPSFFGPELFKLSGQEMPAFYRLLDKVAQELPGLSPNLYVQRDGKAALKLSDSQKSLLHDYELVQYDLFYGKGYAKALFQ